MNDLRDYEQHELLIHGIVGDNVYLYERSSHFRAWVHYEVNRLLVQTPLVAEGFRATMSDLDRRAFEAMTDTRPRLIRDGAVWVQESTGFPVMDEDYIFRGPNADG